MQSRSLMVLRLSTAAIEEIGATPHGRLTIFPIIGGSFEGERLRGRVLAGGGDWVTAMADGTIELDLRATLETDDGALIHLPPSRVIHAIGHPTPIYHYGSWTIMTFLISGSALRASATAFRTG